MLGLAMFKQDSSTPRVSRIRRVATLRSSAGAHAFGLDLRSASYNCPAKREGVTFSRQAAVTLFTSRRDLVGQARCTP